MSHRRTCTIVFFFTVTERFLARWLAIFINLLTGECVFSVGLLDQNMLLLLLLFGISSTLLIDRGHHQYM